MDMKRADNFLPWWVWAIAIMEAAIPTIFGLATLADPGTYIEGATDVTYAIGLYITRNLTTALGIVLALVFRSHIALFILIAVRMITDITDMANATLNGGGEDVVSMIPVLAVVLLAIPALAQWHLWKRIRQG